MSEQAACNLTQARDFCQSYYQNVSFRGGVPPAELDRFVNNFSDSGIFNASNCLLRGGDTEFSWTLVYNVMRKRWTQREEMQEMIGIGLPLGIIGFACNMATVPVLIHRIRTMSTRYAYQLSLTLIDQVTMVLTGVYIVHNLYVYAWESRPLCLYGFTIPFMNSIQSLMLGSGLASNLLISALSADFLLMVSNNKNDEKETKSSTTWSEWPPIKNQIARISLINVLCYCLGFSVALSTTYKSTRVHGADKVDPYRYFCTTMLMPTKAVPETTFCKKFRQEFGAYSNRYPGILTNDSFKTNEFQLYLADKHSRIYFVLCMAYYEEVDRRNFTRRCQQINSSKSSQAVYAGAMIISCVMLIVCFWFSLVEHPKQQPTEGIEEEQETAAQNNEAAQIEAAQNPDVVQNRNNIRLSTSYQNEAEDDKDDADGGGKNDVATVLSTTIFTHLPMFSATSSFSTTVNVAEHQQEIEESEDSTTTAATAAIIVRNEVRLVLLIEQLLAILQMFSFFITMTVDFMPRTVKTGHLKSHVLTKLISEICFGVCFMLACSLNTFFILFSVDDIKKSGTCLKKYLRKNFHPWV